MANPAMAYLTTQVETTTQGELLIMLYEAAIKFLKRAKIEIDNKDFAKKGIYISKAMAIIHELSECLNKDKGGEITPKLTQLYMFCTAQLVKANIRLDKKMLDDVINILDGLRSAYAQIVPIYEGKGTPAGTSPMAAQQPKPQAPPATLAAPSQPAAVPLQTNAYAKPTSIHQSASRPTGQQAQPLTPNPEQEVSKKQPPVVSEEKTKPVTPQPVPPPRPRTAANAARFRAANAYTNSNR